MTHADKPDLPAPDVRTTAFSGDSEMQGYYRADTVARLLADERRKALESAKRACWKVAMPHQATGAMVALECATRIQDLIEEELTT